GHQVFSSWTPVLSRRSSGVSGSGGSSRNSTSWGCTPSSCATSCRTSSWPPVRIRRASGDSSDSNSRFIVSSLLMSSARGSSGASITTSSRCLTDRCLADVLAPAIHHERPVSIEARLKESHCQRLQRIRASSRHAYGLGIVGADELAAEEDHPNGPFKIIAFG